VRLVTRFHWFDSSIMHAYISNDNPVYWFTFLAFWDYDCFQKKKPSVEYMAIFLSNTIIERFEPTTFLIGDETLSTRLYRQSNVDGMHYSLIIKTFSSFHFTTVHANLIEQTTSSIDLVVLKRRIIVVIRIDYRCLLLHRLEQHRRILLSKETYRILAQPADPCENHFGNMI